MKQDEGREFLEELKARQRSIWWHDTLRNGLKVNYFLWNGVSKPSAVQRIGLALFGLSLLLLSISISYLMYEALVDPGFGMAAPPGIAVGFVGLLSFPFIYIGVRLLHNAFHH